MNIQKISFSRVWGVIAVTLFSLGLFAVAQTASAAVTGVTITAPIAGDAWNATQNITWICVDDAVSPLCSEVSLDSISYSPDGGTTWESVGYTSGPFADVGTFSWNTLTGNAGGPNTESTNGVVRVILNSAGINNTSGTFTVDNTSPTISSATTNDADGNGKIDELAVLFDEGMDASITSTAGFTYTGYILGAAGVWSTTTNTNDTLTIPVTENVVGGCSYTDQTGCDTDDTSNVIYAPGLMADPAGNLANVYAATPATDGAKPVMVGAETDDIAPGPPNGQIDTIYVQFSEDVDGTTVNPTGTDFAFSLGYSASAAAETTGPGVPSLVTITLNESGTPDTDVTPLVSIDTGETITDLPGNALGNGDAGSSVTPLDGADPVALKTDYRINPLGTTPSDVTHFFTEFSEPVSLSGSALTFVSGLTITTNGLTGFTGPNAVGATAGFPSSIVFFTTSGATSDLTGVNGGTEPQLTYVSDGINQLVDGAGNAWQSMAITSMMDGAAPAVIDDLSLDTNSDGDVDTLELRLSEWVEDADFTAAALADWLLSSDGFTTSDAFDTFSTNTATLGGGVSVANDDYVQLSLTPSNVSGTGAMQYSYTNDGGDDITDSDANAMIDIAPTTAADGADPVAIKIDYRTNTPTPASVDRFYVTFSESVSFTGTIGNFLSDLTLVANSLTGFATPSAMTAGPSTSILFTTSGATTDLTGVSGGTEPTLAYTNDGVNVLADGAGNDWKSIAATSMIDNAAPVALDTIGATDSKYLDGGNSGSVVNATLVFTETVDWRGTSADYNDGNWTATANGLTGFDVTGSTDDAAGSVLMLHAVSTGITGVGAGTEPTLAYVGGDQGNATVEDGTGNAAAAFTVTLTDDADPVLVGFAANPDPSGIGDNLDFTLTFSEAMNNGVALTGTTFDVAASGAPGPYTTTVNTYTGDTWTGDYSGNPIVAGTPESGTHTFGAPVASGVDPVGNPMAILAGLDMTFVIDSEVPDTIGVEMAPNPVGAGANITITATINDNLGVASAEAFIDGASVGAMTADDGAFDSTSERVTITVAAPAAGGVHEVHVLGTDIGGNTDAKDGDNTETFTVEAAPDTTQPVLDSTSPSTEQVTGSVAPIIFVFSDAVGFADAGNDDDVKGESDVINFTLDGTDILTDANTTALLSNSDKTLTVTYTDANLAVGVHNFNLKVEDAAGNDRQVSATVDVVAAAGDTTAPSIDSTSPHNVQTTLTPALDIDYSDNVAVVSGNVVVKVDGTDVTSGLSVSATNANGVLGALTDNAWHTVYVYVEDAAGNYAETTYSFYVDTGASDTVAPTLTSTSPSAEQTTGSVAPIEFVFADETLFDTTAANNVVEFVLNGTDITGSANTTFVISGGNQVLTLTYTDANLAAGVHNIHAKIKDAAGNTREADMTVSVVATDDTTPPAGSVTTGPATVNADFYVINGTLTSDSDDVTITINDGSGDVGSTIVSAGNTSWSVTVPLPQNTATTFTATATDASSNSATLGSVIIDEDSTLGVDTTPPAGSVTTVAATVNSDFYLIEGTLTADSDDVTITVNNGSADIGSAIVSAGNTSWSVTVPLPQNTATTFTATAKDPSANSATLGSVTITEDSTGPVDITGLSVSGVTDVAGTINWSTDTTPDSGDYRVSTSPYGGTWTAMTIGGTSGTQALAGLTANTTYYYQVRFTKNSQTVYSAPMSFTTASASTGLSIDSIQAIKSYATADDTYTNGWKWKFNVTLNDLTETGLAMKFDQWVSGTNTLDAGGNMQYSVDDATWTSITANGAYPAADIDVSAIDNDTSAGGRQVTLYVEMKVPAGTAGGSYSTQYGVRSQ